MTATPHDEIRTVIALARRAQVWLVRVLYCDNGGLIRGKALPVEELSTRMHSGIGFPLAQQALSAFDELAPVEGLGPVGEFRLVPDPSTFVLLPSAPTSAGMLGTMYALDGTPWEGCPRAFLLRMVSRLRERGLVARIGSEHEFHLARRVPGPFPYQPADGAPLFGMAALDAHRAFLADWLAALKQQGMHPQLVHPEYGPGQMEISLAPAEAVTAADRICLLRETTRAVALQHELVASFAPKPYVERFAGSGLHLHLSLWDVSANARNCFVEERRPDGLSALARQVIGGILAHLPALMALTCASCNSYQRVQPRHWCAAYTCWGIDNREAAVRVPSTYWGHEREALHLELRSCDHSANPYLALGALLAAGLDGLERRLDPGEPLGVDPGALLQEERALLGIHRLPTTLAAALDALEQDTVLTGALGPLLTRAYLAVKRQEIAFCQEMTPQDVAAAYFEKY
jgi:glutamine synthetase